MGTGAVILHTDEQSKERMSYVVELVAVCKKAVHCLVDYK